MAPQKGKQGTKGQKQIVEENKQTIKFYSIMAIAALIVHFIAHMMLWRDSITLSHTLLFLFSVLVYGGCIQTMRYMARASYSETGQLLDGGLDLNMAQAGMGEHLKDLIILTACIQTLSLASTYVWYLWLVAPAYAFYLLWVNVLAPWVFQPAPPEVDDKKQKKLERKGRRH
nr:transmembrane protein 208-like [Rhipicephalus microplus]